MKPIPLPGEPEATLALAKEFGLDEAEWKRALAALGRTPTYAELGVISVMWSEHCSYKSSRVHLKRLPTEGPQVVQGPGENAGAVDIGDGYCAVFKMESHNHPSFIEPYQGAATGVGGILRDVFTMGARPIASLNSLRFGQPDHPKTERLLRGVVAGIGGYGNCIGVPTVGGEVQFDASYNGNILVNAFTVGIARTDSLFFGRAEGIGNRVIYVGARTGRDGIHGATMASAEFGEGTEEKLPTVQVGDPFLEKLLLEACLEIFRSGCLEGVQDMGAAGLTSSSVEMAARAGNGIELDLDMIPRRTRHLTPYEMLLSESQERMLMVAKRGRESEVFRICEKWDLDVAIVGHVTTTGRFVCRATPGYDPLDESPKPRDPTIVVDLPIPLLTDDAPKYDRPQQAPDPRSMTTLQSPAAARANDLPDPRRAILSVIGSPNVGSRQWIFRQYDHIVGAGTVFRPGETDAAVIRVFCDDGSIKYLALAVDCNGRHVALAPRTGAAMAVAECARNVVCTGAKPLGLTDCLNFGNPQRPEIMWQFSESVDGIADACRALGIAVVSGNVSLYNETDGVAILPTPSVAIVGQLEKPEHRVAMAFRSPGDRIALLGPIGSGILGGSEWQQLTTGKLAGPAVPFDLAAEVALQRTMLELAQAERLSSAHDVSDGGLAAALAESAIAGGVGARVRIPGLEHGGLAGALFSEDPSRVVVSFDPRMQAAIQTACQTHGVPFTALGTVEGDSMVFDDICEVRIEDLAKAHRDCLASIVGVN